MNNINILDKTYKRRLIYSFFLKDDINSFDEDLSYKIHFTCLELITSRQLFYFDEVIFIISANDLNNQLINELKIKISSLFINVKNISFIVEDNDKYGREGVRFKKYILDNLNKLDGLTLFFHNKSCQPTYNINLQENPDITYWIIGQYYFNMLDVTNDYLGDFIRNKNKLIFGWPYMCDNWHNQWLIGGSCFWMKCKDIYKYITENNIENKPITSRCIAEYYFPEILDKEQIDYPLSNIIKNKLEKIPYYEPSINDTFLNYLQETLNYKTYIDFINFYNAIINDK